MFFLTEIWDIAQSGIRPYSFRVTIGLVTMPVINVALVLRVLLSLRYVDKVSVTSSYYVLLVTKLHLPHARLHAH